MRKIKFRAWDKNEKEMLDVECLKNQAWNVMGNMMSINNSEWEFMQWTGLKDKNNKDLYENDIVKYKDTNWVIKWNESEAMFWLRASRCRAEYIDPMDQEIVGNIYQDPNLIN